MSNIKTWFGNLSRIAQLSVMSSVVLGGLFFTSAMSPPPATDGDSELSSKVEVETKKEPVLTYKTETEIQAIPYS